MSFPPGPSLRLCRLSPPYSGFRRLSGGPFEEDAFGVSPTSSESSVIGGGGGSSFGSAENDIGTCSGTLGFSEGAEGAFNAIGAAGLFAGASGTFSRSPEFASEPASSDFFRADFLVAARFVAAFFAAVFFTAVLRVARFFLAGVSADAELVDSLTSGEGFSSLSMVLLETGKGIQWGDQAEGRFTPRRRNRFKS